MIKKINADRWWGFTPPGAKDAIPFEKLEPRLENYFVYQLRKDDSVYIQVREEEEPLIIRGKLNYVTIWKSPIYKVTGRESELRLSAYLYQLVQERVFPDYEAITKAEDDAFIQQAIEFEVYNDH